MTTALLVLLVAYSVVYIATQAFYALGLLATAYIFSLPVDWVDMNEKVSEPESEWPYIVLFYPVLRELETTMRTTMLSLTKLEYPADRYRVVAIPNSDDAETIASLRRLMAEFPFLKLLEVPPTTDSSWQIVWDAWDANPKAYWWHQGRRAGDRFLPPKKTRQLIYALYHSAEELKHEKNLAINYIDADSCPPKDHFKGAVIGFKHYDVLQSLNVAGNLNKSQAAAWHAFDHMAWDGWMYPHLSAHGRQPYWLLGKGLFYRVSDLIPLGGFHPWITIEDPEIGLRYWMNGKRLGILQSPLIEEVPETWREGITQRKRWVCGFFQSLGAPLGYLGMNFWQRLKSWLIFVPCLSLSINCVGLFLGATAAYAYFVHDKWLPLWVIDLSGADIIMVLALMAVLYVIVWRRTGLVLTRWQDRVWYMIRVNPLSAFIWWFLWIIPLIIGFRMYLRDEGLAWQRTEKIDANKLLIRKKLRDQSTVLSQSGEPNRE
jgi:cellulose synthase/poly-beta-1,6-N-acetylglucosamine synthase-like glycosyltransferase